MSPSVCELMLWISSMAGVSRRGCGHVMLLWLTSLPVPVRWRPSGYTYHRTSLTRPLGTPVSPSPDSTTYKRS